MKISTRLFVLCALLLLQVVARAAAVVMVNGPAQVTDVRPAAPVLSVYPNPSRGMVMVSINQKAGQDFRLRLSNIIGREVRTIAIRPDLGEQTMPLNLSDLPSGLYFYSSLVDNKVVSTKRIVLQN